MSTEMIITIAISVGIVFSLLLLMLLIIAIIALRKYIGAKSENDLSNVTRMASYPLERRVMHNSLEQEYELVAVITAAVASVMKTGPEQFVVRSIRQVGVKQTPWNIAAKREQQINN